MRIVICGLVVLGWLGSMAKAGSLGFIVPGEPSPALELALSDAALDDGAKPELPSLTPPPPHPQAAPEPSTLNPPPPKPNELPAAPQLDAPPPAATSAAPVESNFLAAPEAGTYNRRSDEPAQEGPFLLGNSCLERLGDRDAEFKAENGIPVTFSAWHWWHVNTGGPLASGYGIPGEDGTYFYSLEFDKRISCAWGPFETAGVYADVRFRDGDPIRPFYPGDCWLYQGYLWGASGDDVFKAGAIWRRFGLDWDGSFWGSVPYEDGFMLSTAWGFSWESTPALTEGYKVDRFLQCFITENTDLSLVGADPMSVNGSTERGTLIGRVVPTVQLSADETLALGVSGLVGQIDNNRWLSLVGSPQVYPSPGDQTQFAWDVDLSYTRGGFRAFAEGLQSYGVLSPARYVSGGPSDRITDFLVGFNWSVGPITYRTSYSMGFDDDPSGTHSLLVPGVTVAVTRNVEVYAEYVLDQVRHHGAAQFDTLENGLQLVLHWRL